MLGDHTSQQTGSLPFLEFDCCSNHVSSHVLHWILHIAAYLCLAGGTSLRSACPKLARSTLGGFMFLGPFFLALEDDDVVANGDTVPPGASAGVVPAFAFPAFAFRRLPIRRPGGGRSECICRLLECVFPRRDLDEPERPPYLILSRCWSAASTICIS